MISKILISFGLLMLSVTAESCFAAESSFQDGKISPPVSVVSTVNALEARNRRTCKQVSSCEEAVEIWCNGYYRADGDNDGIPCENVCSSVEQVDAIRAQIGCQ